MDSADFFANHLSPSLVMGIFRGLDQRTTLELCQKAWESGVQLIEIPLQSHSSLECLQAAVAAGEAIGKPVGAGTITTLARAQAAAVAGASFTVAPGLDVDVITESHRLGLPHLPGVATSTEIGTALRLGLRWLKMFPAAQLGASWIAAQHGPYPEVEFVATGGIDADNAPEFIAAGAAAVAVGSAFSDPGQIKRLSLLARLGTSRDT
ncbi:MAG: eda [Microbacteriaceae bacterium]|nr:eda [Microbacteriaceae bacterium]